MTRAPDPSGPTRRLAPAWLALPAAGLLVALAGCPEAGETRLERGPAGEGREQPTEPPEPPPAEPPQPEPPVTEAEDDPRTTPDLLYEGKLRMVASDHRAAIELFSIVVEREPRNPDGYGHRGSARASVGDIEGALDDYGRALILLPEDDPRAVRIRRFIDQITATPGAR